MCTVSQKLPCTNSLKYMARKRKIFRCKNSSIGENEGREREEGAGKRTKLSARRKEKGKEERGEKLAMGRREF